MARTGQDEAAAANKTYNAEEQTAFNQGQSDIGQFNQNESTLNRGGMVATDPWKSAGYLSNVNRLQSGALNSETNSATDALQRTNRRTGGFNTGAVVGAQKGLALDKMRMGSEMSAGRAAQDFNKNVNYQQSQAQAPLAAAGAESPYFGGAVSGQGGALKDLTDFGMASYGPWNSAIQASGGALAAYLKNQGGQGGGGNN